MSTANPPEHATLAPPYVEEVSDGVFAYIQPDGTWFLNNTGWIAGPENVIAIDATGTEKRAHAFRQAIAHTTSLPITALVNTHSHGDHTHGNFAFAPESAIIAHRRCRDEVLRANLDAIRAAFPGGDFGNPPIVAPFVTFDDRIDLYAGDLRIELIHVGPAHTTNDVLAWLPDRRVLFSGDIIFNGGTPFALAGSVPGWIEALDVLRALEPETIVPGHGPVCGAEVIDEVDRYLRFVDTLARTGFAAGTPPLQLARETDLGEFAHLTDSERLVGNLHRAYNELRGNPRGASLALPTVIGEMVEYNGGQPLRCLA